jgi:hypothetical protein
MPRHRRVWAKDFKTDLRKNNFWKCGLDWTGPHGFNLRFPVAHSIREGFPNQMIFDETGNNILPTRLRNNITQNQQKMECRNVFCTKVKLFLQLITTWWLRMEEWRYTQLNFDITWRWTFRSVPLAMEVTRAGWAGLVPVVKTKISVSPGSSPEFAIAQPLSSHYTDWSKQIHILCS